MANKRQCWICGKEYEYCYKCNKLNSWKLTACSRTHFQIVNILDEYRGGVLSPEQAVEKFNNIGISKIDDLGDILPAVKRDIAAIFDKVNDSKAKAELFVEDEKTANAEQQTIKTKKFKPTKAE